MRNNILSYCITLLLLVGSACDDDFLYKEPWGAVIPEALNTPQGVDYLLVGAYSILDGWAGQNQGSAASIRNWVWDTASDDAYKASTPGDLTPAGEVEQYAALPTNVMIEYKWMVMYDGVSRANDVLKALTLAGDAIAPEDQKILEAQAKFLRAFFHFRLQQMHFQIPYITEVDDAGSVPNDAPAWDKIENDLQFAIDNLPESFPSEPGRATKYAALAVQAYVHLFQQEYGAAKPLLDEIINSEKFALVDSFYHNYTSYTENNIESIFEIQSSVNDGTVQGRNGNADSWLTLPYNRFMPTCCGFYQPSQDLVNAFKVDADGLPLLGINGPKFDDVNLENDMGINSEENFVPTSHLLDPRLDWTVGRRGVPYLDWGVHSGRDWIRDQDNGGPYNSKKQMYYKKEGAAEKTFARATAINYRVIRYAHILLWRAECAVEESDFATALKYVNEVRMRSADDFVMGKVSNTTFGAADPLSIDYTQPAANYLLSEYLSFPNQEYAREAVRMELRLETAMEGNRFFDLVRWGIDVEVLTKYIEKDSQFRIFMLGATYEPKNAHWPIPQSQIDLQKGVLIQDPLY